MDHFRDTAIILALGIVLTSPSASFAESPNSSAVVATTPHFAFHSELATNLHDALLEAGRARNKGNAELFGSGEEQACFEALPAPTQAGWHRAVDFYAEILSPASAFKRERYAVRVDLAGVEESGSDADRRYVEIVRGFMATATPAYDACRWTAQDAENRRWVGQLVPQLERHAESVAQRLAKLYERPLAGLPIRVDVVQTVSWSGANTILRNPVGGHILIAVENEQGPFALELVFHEASHTLMGRNQPVQVALARAARQLDVPLPRDLWHAVLFHTTGDAVSRVLSEAGEPAYTPMMFSGNIFGSFHDSLKRAWPSYLNGDRTLSEAAEDLLRAVGESPALRDDR